MVASIVIVRTWFMDAMIISVCFVFSKQLRVAYCFVITTAIGGANVQHCRYTYYAARIKSVSPSNRLVTQHRLTDHQRRIVVQGDGDHDFALVDHTLKRRWC